MSRPWLSVILPTYNGERYLRAALESILAQGDEQIEVIAIDDGSTDATVQILQSFATRLPLTTVLREHTGNWVAGTNYGLSVARGDYVSFLHQDDLWMEDRLRVLKPVLTKAHSTTMILHASWFIDAHGRRVGLWRCPLPHSGKELDPELVIERLLVQNFIAIPAPLFSREAAVRSGGLDERLWYTADWDFWLKLAAGGSTIYVPRALSAFRIHPDSQTMRESGRGGDFRRQLEIVLDKHLSTRGSLQGAVRQAAQLSVNVNATLAARAHGQRSPLSALILQFLALGPSGWYRYARDSRIAERVIARSRIGLTGRGKASQ